MTTNAKMDQLQAAVQNADDGAFLRELIGFAAQRLMDLGHIARAPEARRSKRLPAPGTASAVRSGRPGATATVIASGRPERALSICTCPTRSRALQRSSSARAPTSRVSWSPGGPPDTAVGAEGAKRRPLVGL